MYKKILVAVDGSEVANGAFEAALQLAKAQDAELLPLYIVEYQRWLIIFPLDKPRPVKFKRPRMPFRRIWLCWELMAAAVSSDLC